MSWFKNHGYAPQPPAERAARVKWSEAHGYRAPAKAPKARAPKAKTPRYFVPRLVGDWRRELGFSPNANPTVEEIRAAHRTLLKACRAAFPDGSHPDEPIINAARDAALAEA